MSPLAFRGDYPFSDTAFNDIAKLANERFGLYLEPCKKQLVYSRLSKRLRFLGLESFEEYCDVLFSSVGKDEQREMLSALTTNVTQFFREKHHFDQLGEKILPELNRRAKAGGRVRFWSAGCSAGQEAYSLSLTILGYWPNAGYHDVRILATDIDPQSLRCAISGRYPSSELKAIPSVARSAHTLGDGNTFVLDKATRRLVTFCELNLMDPWPMKGKFDVILCRNVAIYFSLLTQAKLWKRFSDLLMPGGYLMIGHSERLSGPAAVQLETCGITSYKKLI
jgi:chemotaxis protein methyltransferase CheR